MSLQDALVKTYTLFSDSSVVRWWFACATIVSLVLIAGLQVCFRGTKQQRRSQRRTWAYLLNLAKTAYAQHNYVKLQQILENESINVNHYTDPDSGMTLFLCACLSGNADLVKLLLEKGADYTSTTTSDYFTALHIATYACCTTKSANSRILDLLACHGLSMNAVDRHGNTPLTIAALYGKSDILDILLQYGADPCVPNSKGILPLNFAARSGNLEAAKRLEDTMR